MTNTVTPWRERLRIRSQKFRREIGSTPEVGSSRKRIRRLVQDGGAQSQPLPPAAGQLAREALLSSHQSRHLERPRLACGLPLLGDAVDAAVEVQVLLDGEILVEREPLGHVADDLLDRFALGPDVKPADPARSAGRGEQAREHPDGRGLPGAVGTEKPEDLARGNLEREAVHGDEVAEAALEILDADGEVRPPVHGALRSRARPWR